MSTTKELVISTASQLTYWTLRKTNLFSTRERLDNLWRHFIRLGLLRSHEFSFRQWALLSVPATIKEIAIIMSVFWVFPPFGARLSLSPLHSRALHPKTKWLTSLSASHEDKTFFIVCGFHFHSSASWAAHVLCSGLEVVESEISPVKVVLSVSPIRTLGELFCTLLSSKIEPLLRSKLMRVFQGNIKTFF